MQVKNRKLITKKERLMVALHEATLDAIECVEIIAHRRGIPASTLLKAAGEALLLEAKNKKRISVSRKPIMRTRAR